MDHDGSNYDARTTIGTHTKDLIFLVRQCDFALIRQPELSPPRIASPIMKTSDSHIMLEFVLSFFALEVNNSIAQRFELLVE
jgi:hypothetical protein